MEAIGEGRNSAVALPPWDGGAGRLPRGLGDVVWAGVSTGIFALFFVHLGVFLVVSCDNCLLFAAAV
jgi:hypothetical protein